MTVHNGFCQTIVVFEIVVPFYTLSTFLQLRSAEVDNHLTPDKVIRISY